MTYHQVCTYGAANTILAGEAKNPVIWSKPEDLRLPKDKNKLPALGGLFKSGMNILLCDGSIRFVSSDPDPAIFRALVTPQRGEAVSPDKLKAVK